MRVPLRIRYIALAAMLVAGGCKSGSAPTNRCSAHEHNDERCSKDKSAVQICTVPSGTSPIASFFTETLNSAVGDYRWETLVNCDAPDTHCIEKPHAARAVCVAKRGGRCVAPSVLDPVKHCVDAHTIEVCKPWNGEGAGVYSVHKCSAGKRCAGVGRDNTPTCYTPRPPNRPPALLLYSHGPVRVVGIKNADRRNREVPAMVAPGETLSLGKKSLAVFLVKERVTFVKGPDRVNPYDFQPSALVPNRQGRELEAFLGKFAATTYAEPGPTSFNPHAFYLLNPAPASPRGSKIRLLLAPRHAGKSPPPYYYPDKPPSFVWQCPACGPESVTLSRRKSPKTIVWRKRGRGRVTYDGPPLSPGNYILKIGRKQTFTMSLVRADGVVRDALDATPALRDDLILHDLSKPLANTVVPAAFLYQAGFRSNLPYFFDHQAKRFPHADRIHELRVHYLPPPPHRIVHIYAPHHR